MDAAERLHCALHLKAIGSSVSEYVSKMEAYPESFAAILSDIGPDVFRCMQDGDCALMSREEVIASITSGRSLSYVYCGTELELSCAPNAVVAYEKPGHHRARGGNVLFADGSVKWVENFEPPSAMIEKHRTTRTTRATTATSRQSVGVCSPPLPDRGTVTQTLTESNAS